MSFKEIVGHRRPIAILQRAAQGNRVPSAYLFDGPEGVGKRLVALTLAKALNCEARLGGDSCEECLACRKIGKGIHPDVTIISPEAASLKIEQAREAQRDIALRPYEGRKKVYLFDHAEKMTEECENALLKTLEEPTGEALLILITANPHALLPTVLSRCQRIRFHALPQAELRAYLTFVRGWEEERANFVASLAGGSLGWALQADASDLLALRDEAIAQLRSVLQGRPAPLLDLAEAWSKDRERLLERLELLLIWVRDLTIYAKTTREGLLVHPDRRDPIRKEAQALSLPVTMEFFDAIQGTLRGLSRNANPRLSLENMLFQMRHALQGGKESIVHA